jgi:hypothetical protein
VLRIAECLEFAEACLGFASNPNTSPEKRRMLVEMASKWMHVAEELNSIVAARKSAGESQEPILQ